MKRMIVLVLAGMILCWGAGIGFAKSVSDANDNNKTKQAKKTQKSSKNKQSKQNMTKKKQSAEQARKKLLQRASKNANDPNSAAMRAKLRRDANDINDPNAMSERNKMLARFRERIEEQKRLDAAQGEGAASNLGKEQQKQLEAIKKEMVQEEIKHRTRLAKLERIKELAENDSMTEMVVKADSLLNKEQQRYELKRSNFADRLREIYIGKSKENSK
jgi:hypothetical protein